MLRLGYSRSLFLVAEIGSWDAEDVVQGAFLKPWHDFIHPISVFSAYRSGW